MGKVLDVRGGAGHGEKSGEVGVGCVERKTQSSALEMNSGGTSETLRRGRETDVRNHGRGGRKPGLVFTNDYHLQQEMLLTVTLSITWASTATPSIPRPCILLSSL